jgi:hypothetical protein
MSAPKRRAFAADPLRRRCHGRRAWNVPPSSSRRVHCVATPYACTYLGSADAIFEGTVERTELRRGPGLLAPGFDTSELHVKLRDVRAHRGQSQDVVVTGLGGGNCGYPFREGVRYLIVAGRRASDGLLTVGLYGLTQPLGDAAGLAEYLRTLRACNKTPTYTRLMVLMGHGRVITAHSTR